MSTDIDSVFQAQLAVLVPDLMHLVSIHPHHPTGADRGRELVEILTTRERHEHLCWMLLDEYYLPAARALNPRQKINFTPAIPGPDGRMHDISLDRADPEHRLAVWYARAVESGDRTMAQDTFATIPDELLTAACSNYLGAAANQVRFAVHYGRQGRGPCSLVDDERCR